MHGVECDTGVTVWWAMEHTRHVRMCKMHDTSYKVRRRRCRRQANWRHGRLDGMRPNGNACTSDKFIAQWVFNDSFATYNYSIQLSCHKRARGYTGRIFTSFIYLCVFLSMWCFFFVWNQNRNISAICPIVCVCVCHPATATASVYSFSTIYKMPLRSNLQTLWMKLIFMGNGFSLSLSLPPSPVSLVRLLTLSPRLLNCSGLLFSDRITLLLLPHYVNKPLKIPSINNVKLVDGWIYYYVCDWMAIRNGPPGSASIVCASGLFSIYIYIYIRKMMSRTVLLEQDLS